ncbi:MAG: ATP-dependent DNA helicase RecG [Oligoflexia bacterium]|nr:ATP-dependent DNA helicase RecG [Oligoflexia bacterium]
MPPEARFTTTSSTSPTSKAPGAARSGSASDTDIQYVKGVGPGLGALLKSRGLTTVRDLLYFFPRAYEDRTRILKVTELKEGQSATVALMVRSSRQLRLRTGRTLLEVRAGDESGTLSLKWFHAPRGMESRFVPGAQIIVTGTPKRFLGSFEIIHPEISWGQSAATENVGRVVPIYTELEGISSRVLRKILWEALEKYSATLGEDLPQTLLQAHGLPRLAEAVRTIHFPPDTQVQDLIDFKAPAHRRLIYEEFLKFEFLVLKQRLKMQRERAPLFGPNGGRDAAAELEKLLPFDLTAGQKSAIAEILGDLGQPHPMNRLIQGDVGSGKTAVAFLTAGCVLAEGGQAALMAPTEILAEQHYRNATLLFGGRLNVALLTGKTPGAERTKLLARLAAGEPLLLIGTHALLEAPVEFRNLDYILIDEQHRFGVEQRRTLRHKGTRTDAAAGATQFPHTLVLTATPIPRTLALTAYGDLAISSIRELPPGRTPVVTQVVRERAARARAYERIREELRKGHQAYFIYPLVNDSEAEGFTQLKSAVAESERLQREVFPEFRVGLLHGQQRPDEKAAIMDRYKRRELDILVSTTVVEVGVDVPNATVMVIEHSERFGLSQLHQLRGRVGRGAKQSYCFLFAAERVGENTQARLEVLEETNDGFRIAEADLEIRGPGEFLGTRQSGGLPFKLANLVRDQKWLLQARDDATWLLKSDPDLQLPEHRPLKTFYEREGSLQFDRLKTS